MASRRELVIAFRDRLKSGSHLGAAYTFPGLQKHKGVSYQPGSDDMTIKQLLLNPVNYGATTGFEQSNRFANDTATDISDVIRSTDKEDSNDVTDTDSNEINANTADINNTLFSGEAVLIVDDKNTTDIISTQNTTDTNTISSDSSEDVDTLLAVASYISTDLFKSYAI
jgi:hypothetical protein